MEVLYDRTDILDCDLDSAIDESRLLSQLCELFSWFGGAIRASFLADRSFSSTESLLSSSKLSLRWSFVFELTCWLFGRTWSKGIFTDTVYCFYLI